MIAAIRIAVASKKPAMPQIRPAIAMPLPRAPLFALLMPRAPKMIPRIAITMSTIVKMHNTIDRMPSTIPATAMPLPGFIAGASYGRPVPG